MILQTAVAYTQLLKINRFYNETILFMPEEEFIPMNCNFFNCIWYFLF